MVHTTHTVLGSVLLVLEKERLRKHHLLCKPSSIHLYLLIYVSCHHTSSSTNDPFSHLLTINRHPPTHPLLLFFWNLSHLCGSLCGRLFHGSSSKFNLGSGWRWECLLWCWVLYNSVCLKPENAVRTRLPGHGWESAGWRYVWCGLQLLWRTDGPVGIIYIHFCLTVWAFLVPCLSALHVECCVLFFLYRIQSENVCIEHLYILLRWQRSPSFEFIMLHVEISF